MNKRPHRTAPQEMVTRGVFLSGNEILLVQLKGERWYFLPGGGIKKEETGAQALRREMREELGVRATSVRAIGAVENRFAERYEVNLLYAGRLPKGAGTSQENHLVFSWHPIASLQKVRLFPKPLTGAILKWHRDHYPFVLTINHGTYS
ncbi:MAG: NUDIX domain-containing protein [Patescibacteria group bacterium]|jgi:8-oxo-dGTP pyrophosphatase MutT (NUDIX family)